MKLTRTTTERQDEPEALRRPTVAVMSAPSIAEIRFLLSLAARGSEEFSLPLLLRARRLTDELQAAVDACDRRIRARGRRLQKARDRRVSA